MIYDCIMVDEVLLLNNGRWGFINEEWKMMLYDCKNERWGFMMGFRSDSKAKKPNLVLRSIEFSSYAAPNPL